MNNIVKILHLFDRLLNLYGDNGNVRMLEKRLNMQNVDCEIVKSMPNEIENLKYDFIYMGSGTEKSLCAALKYLKPFEKQFGEQINNGTVILLTGNSFEILGNSIITNENTKLDGLGLLNIETKEDYSNITVKDCIYSCKLFKEKIVGFVNKATKLRVNETPLFKVVYGVGNDESDNFEGVVKNNLFATHLVGPILVKNPAFLELIVQKIGSISKKFQYQPVLFEEATKAHKVTLNKLFAVKYAERYLRFG